VYQQVLGDRLGWQQSTREEFMTDALANINGILRISPDHSLLSELGFKYPYVYRFWCSFKKSGDEFFQLPHEELNKNKLAMWKLVAPFFEICCLEFEPNLVERADFPLLFHSTITKWFIARKFLIKKWNPKAKIHRKKKIRDGYEPLGNLLIHYWYLVKECYALEGIINTRFVNTGHWFCVVFLELVLADLINALYPPDPKEIYQNNLKLGWLERERSRPRLLKDSKNPFTENRQTFALALLIESALKRKESDDDFLKKYWNPFLENYTSYVTSLNSPSYGRLYVKDGKMYHQFGLGRQGKERFCLGTVEDYKKRLFGNLTLYGF